MGLTTAMGYTYYNYIYENQGFKTNLTIFNATVQLGPVSNMGPVSPTEPFIRHYYSVLYYLSSPSFSLFLIA